MRRASFLQIFYLTLFLLIFFFTGCLPIYGPAISQSSKPMMLASVNNQPSSFVSMDYNKYGGFNISENNNLMKFHYYRSFPHKSFPFKNKYFPLSILEYLNFDLSAGLLGYTGIYHVKSVEEYRGKKPYSGFGTESEISVFTELDNTRVGLGMYGALIHETGEYPAFRRNAEKEELIVNFENISTNLFFDIYIMAEMVRPELSPKEKFAFQFGIMPSQELFFTSLIVVNLAYMRNQFGIWGSYYREGLSIGLSYQLE